MCKPFSALVFIHKTKFILFDSALLKASGNLAFKNLMISEARLENGWQIIHDFRKKTMS